MINTLVWLPLAFLCFDRAGEKKSAWLAALGGVVLGISFLAGHAQIFFYALFSIALFCLAEIVWTVRTSGTRPAIRLVGLYALSFAACIGVAAILLVPWYGDAVSSEHALQGFAWKSHYSLSPGHLLSLVAGWGLETLESWRESAGEFFAYAGLVSLFLAAMAVAWPQDRRVVFFAVLAVLALLLSFGRNTWVFRLAYEFIPGFSLFRVPSRTVFLVDFSISILAGYGVHRLLSTSPEDSRLGAAFRAYGWAVVVFAVWLAFSYVVLLATAGQPGQASLESLVSHLGFGLTVLVVGLLGLIVLNRRPAHKWAAALLLIGAVGLDVAWGEYREGGSRKNPDVRSPHEKAALDAVKKDTSLYRISDDNGVIHATTRYRERLGVYMADNRFIGADYIALTESIEKNPRILDMLNVKYVVGTAPRRPAAEYLSYSVSTLSPLKRIRVVPSQRADARLAVESHLSDAAEILQGMPVAEIRLIAEDGTTERVILRAGSDTAEWALDRPGLRAGHGKAEIVRSTSVSGEGFMGHMFRTARGLRRPMRPVTLEIQYLADRGSLHIEKILLGAAELSMRKDRFASVGVGIEANQYSMPRSFLVPRAAVIPDRIKRLKALEVLEPRDVVILEKAPSGYQMGAKPLGRALPDVRIEAYEPNRVVLEAEVQEPAFLVLSDSFHKGWKATDNGRPVDVMRANLALRAVYLKEAGRHRVEFRFQPWTFYAGAALTGGTVLVLAGWGVRRVRKGGNAV
jgi:hypothetical protein